MGAEKEQSLQKWQGKKKHEEGSSWHGMGPVAHGG